MIKEGSYLFVEGQRAVEPYRGKYAVKVPDVFDRVRQGWAAAGLNPDSPYLPMRIEMELTTKCSIGLPSLAITGGEPFTAWRALLVLLEGARDRGIDISKLTTNGIWGTSRRCGPVFDRLEKAGFLDARLFVPLLMLSIGEQTTPLEDVARILHHAVTHYTVQDLNVAVSSLADPATREHKVDELMAVYEKTYGDFPHDRVHSTMRVYLTNERLDGQAAVNRPGQTPVSRWMDQCFDCFAPTVGAYILPTSLMKQDGCWYSCAAFNVPEKLAFGNLLREPARKVLARANDSTYIARVRAGRGLKALHDVVPPSYTKNTTCTSFCDSCALLIGQRDKITGEKTGAPVRAGHPRRVPAHPRSADGECPVSADTEAEATEVLAQITQQPREVCTRREAGYMAHVLDHQDDDGAHTFHAPGRPGTPGALPHRPSRP